MEISLDWLWIFSMCVINGPGDADLLILSEQLSRHPILCASSCCKWYDLAKRCASASASAI